MKRSGLTSVGATHWGRPLTATFAKLGVRGGTPLRSLDNPPSSPLPTGRQALRKGGILTPPFGRLFPARGRQGRRGGILTSYLLKNSKGISVLFLIVALLLMMAVGYVLSYLIPTKQKSVGFPIYSTQAFYLAQSGMEYGVRYCSEQGWRGATDSGRLDYDRLNDVGAKNLVIGKVNGKFTIDYSTGTNILTSTGEINNSTEKRIVTVSNFNQFLRLTFTSSPCWLSGYSNQRARFSMRRWRGTTVTLRYFSATWQQSGTTRYITTIRFGNNTRFSGTYYSGSGIVILSANQSIGTGGVNVQIWWNQAMSNPRNLVIAFYTAAGAAIGEGYTFNLDPAGNNLPGC